MQPLINFAASLISLFYGNGDFKRTLQIATLAGWDSDNPAATWGGFLGFLFGAERLELAFEHSFPDAYWIHRTRRGFVDHTPGQIGEDSFTRMADRGVTVVDKTLAYSPRGFFDSAVNAWRISVSQ